jgi:hypothetical protein
VGSRPAPFLTSAAQEAAQDPVLLGRNMVN